MINKSIFLIGMVFISFTFIIFNVGATCVTIVTLHDENGDVMRGDIYARCENQNQERMMSVSDTGIGVLQSFGGPFDTCEEYCGQVWVTVSNDDLDLFEEAVYYPMDSSNQEGWGERTVRHYVDLLFDGKTDESDSSVSSDFMEEEIPKSEAEKKILNSGGFNLVKQGEDGLIEDEEEKKKEGIIKGEDFLDSGFNWNVFLIVLAVGIFLSVFSKRIYSKVKFYKETLAKKREVMNSDS